MNEQEYEKSIAEPIWGVTPKYLLPDAVVEYIHRIRAEREFSRGVWEEFKRARRQIETIMANLGQPIAVCVPQPVPDATPKPDPRLTPEFGRVSRAMLGATFTKLVADEIIREVRARTVK